MLTPSLTKWKWCMATSHPNGASIQLQSLVCLVTKGRKAHTESAIKTLVGFNKTLVGWDIGDDNPA